MSFSVIQTIMGMIGSVGFAVLLASGAESWL